MAKPKTNYIIDVLMAVAFLGVAVTGVIKWPGLFKGADLNWFLLSRIHDWSGAVMAVLVLIHLVLHWKWIVCTTKTIFFKKKEKCEI